VVATLVRSAFGSGEALIAVGVTLLIQSVLR
jgi:hypothetical protein